LDAGVAYHPVGHPRLFGYPYELNYYSFHRLFVRECRALLAELRPDVLYQRLSLANYAGARLARDLGIPLVVEYNGSEVWIAKHWGRPLRFPRLAQLLEERMLREADAIVTVSRVLRDELVARGIDAARIVVYPNCVDPERFSPARFTPRDRGVLLTRHGIDPSSVVCVFIGTFGMWHGVTVLAEAIRALADADRRWLDQHRVHFLLVGDGLLMPRVREILEPPHAARYVTLTAADVLLPPHVPNADGSRFFGSPTKLFEYMAMEKAIVASDLEQIGEVLRRSYRAAELPEGPCPDDEKNMAVLARPGSREELVAGVRFLVEHPDYRRALGRNARQEVLRHYTWDRNVEALLQRLQSLAGAWKEE